MYFAVNMFFLFYTFLKIIKSSNLQFYTNMVRVFARDLTDTALCIFNHLMERCEACMVWGNKK